MSFLCLFDDLLNLMFLFLLSYVYWNLSLLYYTFKKPILVIFIPLSLMYFGFITTYMGLKTISNTLFILEFNLEALYISINIYKKIV